MTADGFIAHLEGVQGRAPHWRAMCPAHPSKHGTRSLSIREGDDGRLLLRCHAGCEAAQIVGALGLELADLFPPRGDEHIARPTRRPWRVRDVVAALRGELYVAGVLLMDVAAGTPHSDSDRSRARQAAERIGHFLDELEHAG